MTPPPIESGARNNGPRDNGADLSPVERRELLARLLRARAGRSRLSFSQERLWFLHQLVPDTPVYNVPAAVRLTGRLDTEVLERSLGAIVERHEVLRTCFERHKEGPVPVVRDGVGLALEREDLRSLPAGRREARALTLANEEARRPFDLEHGPLLRALLVVLDDEDHLLVLTLHHIVAEGWSVALLLRELEQFYKAGLVGESAPLEPLPMQYADYARWQRERAQGDTLAEELEYWRNQLAGELPVLELPTDRPRPPVQTFGGAWRSRRLPAALVESANTLAQSQGATLFMVLLAAFQTLLHRYTGQTDSPIGSPIAGRTRAEAEQLIGVFINTLVMRPDLDGDPSFAELLERVRETAVGAFSHQEIPFEQIVEKLQPDRHLSHTPIFQVMFAMQNTPLPALELEGLEPGHVLDPGRVHNGTTKVDLAVFVEQAGDELEVGCEYSTDLFDASTIERLLGHLEVLVAAAVDQPDERISRLPMLTGDERHQILVEWNDTATPVPDEPVHRLFERHVEERPDATAVVFNDVSLTYAELDRQANQLAHHLLSLGVGAESRVGLLTRPSHHAVVAMLAAAKAGAAYLPLDPAFPSDRLTYLLQDAQVEVLLSQESLLMQLTPTDARIICLDQDAGDWAACPVESPDRPTSLDRLAYVIYTSGSTGRPKGVEKPHRGLANLVAWHRATYQLTPDDRSTQLAGLAFDASVWETWPTLASGGALHLVSHEKRLSPETLIEFFDENDITVAFVPTPLTETLLQSDWPSDMALRDLLTGGSQLHGHAPVGVSFRLINHYGPTENTVVTTAGPVASTPSASGLPDIGRPITNSRVYILDRNQQLVPVGVPGELCVAGTGLARCYHGSPAQTAERFLPDPFGAAGERLYATGDLARYLSDGRIEFLGRLDRQVKVRGYRIELGEIETILRSHRRVHEAVVIPTDSPDGLAFLTAYTTSLDDGEVTAEELRSHLRRSLPDYMIPAVYLQLAEMPLTPNGKIDHDALPRADEIEPAHRGKRDSPRQGLEDQVATIWREFLPTDDIGAHDSFFELGGHSLMLVEVHARLRDIVNAEISVVDLFRYPTIASLVAHLESLTARPTSDLTATSEN